jgi:hypothetical protein
MVKIRRAYEVLFLGLFLFFLVITDLRYLKGWPVSLFLEATPLVAVATALTTHTIYRNLVWGLVIIAITMMLGRVWCNWMCPFGILHHFFGWIGNRRNTKQAIESNRYRKIYAIKYYILAAMLVMAAMWVVPAAWHAPGNVAEVYRSPALKSQGIARAWDAVGRGVSRSIEESKTGNSTLQIGLLDPIAHGSFDDDECAAIGPQVDREHLHGKPGVHVGLDRRRDLRGVTRRELVDSSVFLPCAVPAGRIAGRVLAVCTLADRPRPGALHRL